MMDMQTTKTGSVSRTSFGREQPTAGWVLPIVHRRGKIVRLLVAALAVAIVLSSVGCVTPFDIRSIAEGQFISFVNTLINAATADTITGILQAGG